MAPPSIENKLPPDYSGAHLYGHDFANATLDGANFENANLDNARLTGASLRGANLRYTRLCEASLRDATLDGADLRHAVLAECCVEGASLTGADLRGAHLHRLKDWERIASLDGANIYGVKEAPEGFVEWALEQGAKQEAPPPSRWEPVGNHALNALKLLGRALSLLPILLEYLPVHSKQVHRRLARRGTKAIARWRMRNDGRHLELDGASLPGVKLAGAALDGSNMANSDLSGADLYAATLGQNLTRANLSHADLRYAAITGNCRDANLENARLKGAVALMADMDRANLRGANLEAADFSCARLPGADLRDADCSHTSFDSAELDGVRLSGATFAHANFYEGRLANCDLTALDFTGANFSNCDLSGVTNHDKIAAIKGATVYGVRNAPEGFVAWALDNGAVEEHRNRSWVPLEDRKGKADRTREEMAERARLNYGTHRILWAPTLAGMLFLITGIGGMIWGTILPTAKAIQMWNWEAVDGEILASRYAPIQNRWLSKIPSAEFSKPEVEFRYTWEGNEYTSTRALALPTLFSTRDEGEKFTARYPQGATVTAHVNPNAPDQAVLEKATFQWDFLLIFLGTGLWTFCGAIATYLSLMHHDRSIYH